MAQDESEMSPSGLVEVCVAAEPSQLGVMRAVIGDLSMRADFDLDSIADLRLAVDEACSTLIRLAAPQASLLCQIRHHDDRLDVAAEVTSDDAVVPREDTFSWRILSALTDNVSASADAESTVTGRHLVRIELTKARAVYG